MYMFAQMYRFETSYDILTTFTAAAGPAAIVRLIVVHVPYEYFCDVINIFGERAEHLETSSDRAIASFM